mmetsp:Transcript_21274/g.46661  ORF Transcript_21274/g.46661 Transcript_21274/m.46661 type:complete len:223 (+) Transcript_21274:2901-3569(+)
MPHGIVHLVEVVRDAVLVHLRALLHDVVRLSGGEGDVVNVIAGERGAHIHAEVCEKGVLRHLLLHHVLQRVVPQVHQGVGVLPHGVAVHHPHLPPRHHVPTLHLQHFLAVQVGAPGVGGVVKDNRQVAPELQGGMRAGILDWGGPAGATGEAVQEPSHRKHSVPLVPERPALFHDAHHATTLVDARLGEDVWANVLALKPRHKCHGGTFPAGEVRACPVARG